MTAPADIIQEFVSAILDAFTRQRLAETVLGLGVRLDQIAAVDADLTTVVYGLIDEFNRRDDLGRLAACLVDANPTNQRLRAIAGRIGQPIGRQGGRPSVTYAVGDGGEVIREMERIRAEIGTLRASLFGDAAIRQAGLVDKLDEIERDLRGAQHLTERLLEQVRLLRWLVAAVMVSTLVILFSLWVMQWVVNNDPIGLIYETLLYLA